MLGRLETRHLLRLIENFRWLVQPQFNLYKNMLQHPKLPQWTVSSNPNLRYMYLNRYLGDVINYVILNGYVDVSGVGIPTLS